MNGRLTGCDAYRQIPLSEGWELAPAPTQHPRWFPACVPGTVASSLRDAGEWSFDSPARRFDAEEWNYRTRFVAEPRQSDERIFLGFEGLATLAQVRLNDAVLFDSSNMFRAHRVDVSEMLGAENELTIRFSPIDAALKIRRPRPRWRTPMVEHQQLRWIRASLLGRTPGWSPPAAPVGPWRPIWLERQRWLQIDDPRWQATLIGTDGRLSFSATLSALSGTTIRAARLIARRSGTQMESELILAPTGVVHAELWLPNVDLWWPHTHGEACLYQATLLIEVDHAGTRRQINAPLGEVGFRSLRLEREAGRFSLHVNEQEIFCRGAAWMPLDCVSLQATPSAYAEAIERVRDAGMNMLRVAGPTVYESDAFFDCCDSAGVMIWQDFMFANMDYPAEDPEFAASVRIEASQQLSRLQGHPSLVVLCGNSEGAQQAAMSGAPRECWAPRLFEVELAALVDELAPGVPYCPSSTHGGAFPFQPNEGVSSYYGVGAYLKPLNDARRSGVRFASECLAFANVPQDETLASIALGHGLRCHHARWKERSPRDLGAGWDFDDVRDFYLESLFRVDAMRMRYADHDRYLQFSRVASGEVMAAAFAEWRRAGSSCGGALVWFLNDLWPGAGWGVIDSTGLPKAAYYYVKRVLQPLALTVSDEDCNGLTIHLVNESRGARRVLLELRLFKGSAPIGVPALKQVDLPPASTREIAATDLLEGFMDLSYSFRFGPPAYDLLHAALYAPDERRLLAEAFHFPQGLPNATDADPGLSASAAQVGAAWRLDIQSKHFAQSVHVDAPGFVADDQYFHMIPNSTRALTLVPRKGSESDAFNGTVQALNAASPYPIRIAR